MKKRCMFLLGTLLVPALVMGGSPSEWGKKKARASKTEVKAAVPESDYSKLFKGKKCETRKGMITIHKVDDAKVYFEFPLALQEREMLFGSAVTEISNNEHSVLGYQSKTPMHIQFQKSFDKMNLCLVNCLYTADPKDPGIETAVKMSTIGSIFKSFKIESYTPDSTAVVFDVTDLFMDNIKELDPFDPYSRMGYKPYSRSYSYEKSNSHLGDVKAFEDNVSVKSYMTYKVDVTAQVGNMNYAIESKNAFTALVTRSILLLPKEPMRSRIADPRMAIFVSGKARFSSNNNRGTEPVYLAHRWNLEPADVEAYRRGELVEPVKPIVFYLDENFPEMWRKYLKLGIEDWNLAFEKIGFKNAVKALDYPKNDPEFDPDNLKYSCVRYQPISIENAMGPSWVDPRSGEIITASVMVYHDIIRLINNWRFVLTAPADPRVRTMNIPEDIMGEALRYVVAHEIGHCLAFMHNMAASAAIPTDSLRSPSYTQKYGTTMSIMDYARFNYVAQPGDVEKGVKMTPPLIGECDYFNVKWLYTPIFDVKTSEEEVPILDKWVSEKAGDPRYRYGKQQIFGVIDPSAQTEDLGDDLVKSSEYGVKNLKYLMAHLNEWIGDEDKDYSYRESIYRQILQQYIRYIFHVYAVKGGLYLNERYAGDPRASYEFIDGDYQRRAMDFLCTQLKDLDWLENTNVLKELPLQGNLSTKVQRLLVQILMADGASLIELRNPAKNAYTTEENQKRAFDCIFSSTKKGCDLTARERTNQNEYLNMMIMLSGLDRPKQGKGNAIAVANPKEEMPVMHEEGCTMCKHVSLEEMLEEEEYMGFGYFRGIPISMAPRHHVYYAKVKEARALISRMKNTGSKETQLHYELILHRIDGLLK